MLPEEKLLRQAALARHQSQTQKVKQCRRNGDSSNATIIGYNAALGANIIQRSDGSINYAGSDTNGALALGETLPLHGGTMRVDGLPNIEKQKQASKKTITKTITSTFKILFSVVEDKIQKFYIGGDRKVPYEIASFNTDDVYVFESYIVNSGKELDDWIVTLRYQDFNTRNIITCSIGKDEHNWQFSSPPRPNQDRSIFTEYRGSGVWLSDAPVYANTNYPPVVDLNPSPDVYQYTVERILSDPLFMEVEGGQSYYEAFIGGNCNLDGSPYIIDGVAHYRPMETRLAQSYSASMGSFAIYAGIVKSLVGSYAANVNSSFERLCADNLESRGTKDTLYTEQLTHFLSNTITGEVIEYFEARAVEAGINYSDWSAITPRYREYEDGNILVALGGETCISYTGEETEVVESYGKNSSVRVNFIRSSSAKLYLNKTVLKEYELDNSPTFSFVSPVPLNLNENTTTIEFSNSIVYKRIPFDLYDGYTNSISNRNSRPLNFDLVGQTVEVTQFANKEKTEYWLATGVITSVDFIPLDTNNLGRFRAGYIRGMTITLSEIKKTFYEYSASENGTISCLSNPLISLLFNQGGFFHPEYNYILGGGFSSIDYAVTNFVGNKIFLSRKPLELMSKSGTNYAEVWEFIQSNGKLTLQKQKLISGKVHSLKAPTNYLENSNVTYKIESISYFPANKK